MADENIFRSQVEKDGDDIVVTLPDAIIKKLNLSEGDTLTWSVMADVDGPFVELSKK